MPYVAVVMAIVLAFTLFASRLEQNGSVESFVDKRGINASDTLVDSAESQISSSGSPRLIIEGAAHFTDVPSALVLTVDNSTGVDQLEFDPVFYIEKLVDGQWDRLDRRTSIAVQDMPEELRPEPSGGLGPEDKVDLIDDFMAAVVNAGESITYTYPVEMLYGDSLLPGTYRVITLTISEGIRRNNDLPPKASGELTCEFTIG